MTKLLQQIIRGEKGQALPIVLVLLAVGGLLITPTLNLASTSLNTGRIVEEKVKGLYAADAGIEHALWSIKNSTPPPTLLPDNINQMEVIIDTEPKRTYAFYSGEIIIIDASHYDWLTVEGEIVPEDEELQIYRYTITVTWQPQEGEPGGGNCKLIEIGVRLPVGYSYQTWSAGNPSFGDNLSTGEPEDVTDPQTGAHLLNWEFSPQPQLTMEDNEATQTFYITGEGEPEGDYTWAGAVRQDVGQVGEVTGTLYRITARATRPGDVNPTATIMADVMWNETEEEITILLWQINPEQE